jgi:class 3 adenylate cyclase
VLCSEATADVIGARPGVGFEPLGPVFVRGIAEPVPIVRVLVADYGELADGLARDTTSR